MANGRRASIAAKFNGKNVSTSIGYYLKSIAYEDPSSGESDTISIEMHNIDMRWLGSWAPVQGDEVEAGVLFRGFGGSEKSAVNFGTFVLDDVQFQGGPLSLSIGAISQPATTGFASTKRTFTWSGVQLKEIAQKIADKYEMTLVYEAGDAAVENIEQDDQTDAEFLKQLCEKYAFALKIFNSKIVIFDVATYEAKTPVATLTRSSFIGDGWKYHSELAGMYEACEISYTNAKENKDIKVRVGKSPSYASESGEANKMGTAGMDTVRCLYINEKVDSEAEARQKALAALNNANRGITTLSGEIVADPKIFSTSVVEVKGMGIIDGKYFVRKMSLTIDPSSGSTQDLDLYKIYEQVTDQPAETGGKNVGDIVNFKGGTQYISSYAGSKGYSAKAGPAKITSFNDGQQHPYHLIHTDASSNVYGWVDEGTF